MTKALDEEDPQVIKELIDLIKKVGGLDKLEEQLRLRLSLNENSAIVSSSKSGDRLTTISPISQSLYEKVLSSRNLTSQGRQFLSNKFTSKLSDGQEPATQRQNKENKYSSVIRNSRPGPQNEGIDKLADSDVVIKERPQYVTLTRVKIQKEAEEEDDEDEENDNLDEVEEPVTKHQTTQLPQYVLIRRNRPSTTEAADVEVEKEEETYVANETPNRSTSQTQYTSINRNRQKQPQDNVEKGGQSNVPETK